MPLRGGNRGWWKSSPRASSVAGGAASMVRPVGATRGRETSFMGLARGEMKGDAATRGKASSVMAHPLARNDRARHQADQQPEPGQHQRTGPGDLLPRTVRDRKTLG